MTEAKDFQDYYDLYTERFSIVVEDEGYSKALSTAFTDLFEELEKSDLSFVEKSKMRTGVQRRAVKEGIIKPLTSHQVTQSW